MLQAVEETAENLSAIQRSRGTGRLSVVSLEGKTRTRRLFQQGCAKIRIPAWHHSNALEAVVINTSGGMTGGDQLNWQFHAGPGAGLSVTTQASEKIYRSGGGHADANVNISVGAHSRFAWLPQKTIMFDQSRLRRRIVADIGSNAEALFVEPVVFGRTAMGETPTGAMTSLSLNDGWRIRQDGRLIHAEALSISGDISDIVRRSAVMSGNAAMATLLLVSPTSKDRLDETRKIVGNAGAVSAWNGKLLARIVARDGYALHKILLPLIDCLSPLRSVPKSWSL